MLDGKGAAALDDEGAAVRDANARGNGGGAWSPRSGLGESYTPLSMEVSASMHLAARL